MSFLNEPMPCPPVPEKEKHGGVIVIDERLQKRVVTVTGAKKQVVKWAASLPDDVEIQYIGKSIRSFVESGDSDIVCIVEYPLSEANK